MNRRRSWAWALLAVPLLVAAQQLESLTVVLKHKDVRSVLARVTEELGPQGQVVVDGPANRITIRDDADRLAAVRRILADLDTPARHFAMSARLELLPKVQPRGLFKAAPGFVDMTQWAESVAPTAVYEGVVDLYEGKAGECLLGRDYRFSAHAGGYDPTRRRLALSSLGLERITEGHEEQLIRGAAVLPEGEPTSFLVGSAGAAPALRLRTTPTLLPVVARPGIP